MQSVVFVAVTSSLQYFSCFWFINTKVTYKKYQNILAWVFGTKLYTLQRIDVNFYCTRNLRKALIKVLAFLL